MYTVCYKVFKPFYYSKKDTVAVMFCGAAKTAALGVSLISSQYGDDTPYLGKLLVPLVLYQSEQVITASWLVPFFKKWSQDEDEKASTESVDLETGLSNNSESNIDKDYDASNSSQGYNQHNQT